MTALAEKILMVEDDPITRADVRAILEAAGFDQRLRNGDTDYDGKHTYAEALFYLRETDELTPEQKRLMLGETAERVLRWR